ncbi:MAG: alpha/beta hydrolase [Anaerolineales bacterium]|nr:alpha/beta hydrolase [Anaerolineales bacterium]MCB8937233.1 alpha/beta hydrolase [Ardenticatenaceae bacterium]
MSSIVTEQGILHYESIGRGQPIILLHGWINSWDVWRDMMINLANTKRYRVYALDFWGFGDSAKGSQSQTAAFQIDGYVNMVQQFMDSLGIQNAPIFGHSMGGTVALQISLTFPERVEKVALVGSPIIGRSLHPFLRMAGNRSIAKLVWRYPIMLHSIMRILLAKDSKKVRNMIYRDVQRTTIESFFLSIGDLRDTDLRNQLPKLNIPTLGIYGAKDKIVSPMNADLLKNGVKTVEVQVLDQSRHFPMTDEPKRFLQTVHSFLNNSSDDQVLQV